MKLHVLYFSEGADKLEIYSSEQQVAERIQRLPSFIKSSVYHYVLEDLEEYYDLCEEIMDGVIDYAYWAIPELNLNFDYLNEIQIFKLAYIIENPDSVTARTLLHSIWNETQIQALEA